MVFFIFIQILMEHSVSKQSRPDQTLCSSVPALVLRFLPMSLKNDSRLCVLDYLFWNSPLILQIFR